MKAVQTLAAINRVAEANQEAEFRNHLGASVLGNKCLRAVWYGFRWVFMERFEGRMLRLFERGQNEETRFFGYLRSIGCETWETDPATGKQFRISFGRGHGGGSADGVARGIPDLPEGTPFLVECKTHNDKSFSTLQKDGLCQAKPEHFAQVQLYTVKLGLPAALYMAANKNTDELHLEVIQPNPDFVATLIRNGETVIDSQTPPPRVNANPSFYLCKWCKFSEVCHKKALPLKNCRTCRHSAPVDGGQWFCGRYGCTLDKAQQHAGCQTWELAIGFRE